MSAGREGAAGARAGEDQLVEVAADRVGIRRDPLQGRVAVLGSRRKGMLRGESIVDRDDHAAVVHRPSCLHRGEGLGVHEAEGAAMDLEEDRQRTLCAPRSTDHDPHVGRVGRARHEAFLALHGGVQVVRDLHAGHGLLGERTVGNREQLVGA